MVDFSGFLPTVGGAFVDWLKLFAAPAKNFEMLWIIIPIWGVWVFSEFFQEKKGTSFGNAISNGATMLFVGVDWTRYVIRQLSSGSLAFGAESITLLVVAAAVLIYGLTIIVLGIKANKFVRAIGRVRETTYFMVMFSPIIYSVEDLNLRTAAIILAFFPLFYLIVELIDRVLPNPRMFEAEEEEKDLSKDAGIGRLGSDFGQDVFGTGQQGQQTFQGGFQNQPFQNFQNQPFPPQQQQQQFSRSRRF